MRTRFERQQQLCRIDRWFQDFHRHAPFLFWLMCAGISIFVFAVTFSLIDLIKYLAVGR